MYCDVLSPPGTLQAGMASAGFGWYLARSKVNERMYATSKNHPYAFQPSPVGTKLIKPM